MKKRVFSTELAYLLGIVFITIGVTLMEKADFGVSMVVAPAYLVYRFVNPMWEAFSFGMAEYCLQAVLLIGMVLVLRKFKLGYLFAFVTAVFYGFVLDGFMALLSGLPTDALWLRLAYYFAGMVFCAAGVSLMFHTYVAPEVYELLVKEVSDHFHMDIHKFKTGYDICSFLVGLTMSFAFFGFGTFVGVSWGTVVCALVNGWIIGQFSHFFERHWTFEDQLPLRPLFEK